MPKASVRQLHALTGGHPFYVQHLCHALWERCPEGEAVTGEAIDEGVSVLLRRESYAYTTLWQSLPLNQRRFLRGLATATGPVQPFSADFLQRSGLQSPSTAQRVAEELLTRDMIDRENGVAHRPRPVLPAVDTANCAGVTLCCAQADPIATSSLPCTFGPTGQQPPEKLEGGERKGVIRHHHIRLYPLPAS